VKHIKLSNDQLQKLNALKKSIVADNKQNKKDKSLPQPRSPTYCDIIEYLESKPIHRIYDSINNSWLKVQGYLSLENGSICPIIFNHTYMLRALKIQNKELILDDVKSGYLFVENSGNNTQQNREKISKSVSEYNRKMELAINEFPKSEHLFKPKTITSFKIL